MKRAFVFGDAGLLGQSLLAEMAGAGFSAIEGVSGSAFTANPNVPQFKHRVMDLTAPDNGWQLILKNFSPDLVVNAAANTNVDACERNEAAARALHALFPGRLAQTCRLIGARLVQVSTDQVFNGVHTTPYSESDEPDPITVYGRTKREGEESVLAADPAALVLRTNIAGVRGRTQPTFGEWLCACLESREPITLAEDFVTSTLFVGDFARVLLEAARKGLAGIYHAASSEPASKYAFGRLVADELQADFSNVRRGRLADLNLKPARPAYIALDVRRFEAAAGLRMPDAKESAARLARDYKKRKEESNG